MIVNQTQCGLVEQGPHFLHLIAQSVSESRGIS